MTGFDMQGASDLGEIATFSLPQGWREGARQEAIGGRTLHQFQAGSDCHVRFCIYIRTLPVSYPAAVDFQKILYGQFRDLLSEDIARLGEVLEGMSNQAAFEFNAASTNYLNDRRVLQVEGRWLKADEDTLAVFVDVDGTGRYVQQIYFTAPAGALESHLSLANSMFTSIKWKQRK